MLSREAQGWAEFQRRYEKLARRCIQKVLGRFPSVPLNDHEEVYGSFLLSLNMRDMHKLRAFDCMRGTKFSSWIGRLATNSAWDHLRSRSRQPAGVVWGEATDSLVSHTVTPFEQYAHREALEHVADALDGLSGRDRAFVSLFYVNGLEPEEVATRMHISVKTVYTKNHKIRTKLRTAMDDVSGGSFDMAA